MPKFELLGPAHLGTIVLTFALPLGLAVWARRGPNGGRTRVRVVAWLFAALLLFQLVFTFVAIGLPRNNRWQDVMPLQLCHFALFASVWACLFRQQLAFELAYFWGLAGTLQGLITPGLAYGFPTLDFLMYFIGHGGIVAAVLFLVAGARMRPHWASVRRAYLGALAYAAIAGSFNALFGTNYGFLARKPPAATLFDYLGPWPWYIGSLLVLAGVNFILLYLPWAIADAIRRPALAANNTPTP